MKILQDRSKGFLSIAVSIIVLVIILNLILTSHIVINRSKRFNTSIEKSNVYDNCENLQQVCYDILLRLDKSLSNGSYNNSGEYIGKTSDDSRVWFKNSNESTSSQNYKIIKMRFNNHIFFNHNDRNINFLPLLKNQLLLSYNNINYLDVELIQKFKITDSYKVIVIKAIVRLEYKKGDRNPLTPNKEYLKEIVANFENY